jgi:hypothetical protein
MKYLGIIFAAIFVLISTPGLRAQTLLLNQNYVNQFPSVDRVKADEKGTDAVDTYARFVAALNVLSDIMLHDLVTAPNGGTYNMPPAADRVHDWYSNAITKNTIDEPEPQSKDPRYRPLRDKYESDPAFKDSVLQRYFTPQFRTDYYAWTRKPMPATTAVKATAPTAVASNDPSILKAKAAKVDLGVFAGSIHLGEPLRLPRCPYEKSFLGMDQLSDITQDCEDIPPPLSGAAADAANILVQMLPAGPPPKPGDAPDPNIRFIRLVDEHCPSWMDGNAAAVRVSPNGIERVLFNTKGRVVQSKVAEELLAKYGTAHYSNEGTITPDVGNAFKVTNMDWVLPGLRVEYKVIEPDQNGRVKVDGTGYVRIETESAYQARIAAEKKAAPKKVL